LNNVQRYRDLLRDYMQARPSNWEEIDAWQEELDRAWALLTPKEQNEYDARYHPRSRLRQSVKKRLSDVRQPLRAIDTVAQFVRIEKKSPLMNAVRWLFTLPLLRRVSPFDDPALTERLKAIESESGYAARRGGCSDPHCVYCNADVSHPTTAHDPSDQG